MTSLKNGVYGAIPRDLLDVPADSAQCSPQMPGASVLSQWPRETAANLIVHAPASTIERRAVLAIALRALAPSGRLIAFAANTKGGSRIADELEGFGCAIETSHKRRHQIVTTSRPAAAIGIDEAITAGAPRLLPDLDLWSQPGLFNWDHIDAGSQLLMDHLPPLSGRGADLGCGLGIITRAIRRDNPAANVTLIDIDSRALELARRNVSGDGIATLWTDVRTARELPTGLDFVVSNPPFHDAGEEDKTLGQAFIMQAARMLKPGGVLWLTANRHLPYEATLKELYASVEQVAQAQGYKIYAATKSSAPQRVPAPRVRK
ncbi:MAG: class I SAM-dependent methyltransferase [Hyphomicrobium sp.]|nr:class I SAM-dependent methyltransferase [Hyphomicrobium sp.]